MSGTDESKCSPSTQPSADRPPHSVHRFKATNQEEQQCLVLARKKSTRLQGMSQPPCLTVQTLPSTGSSPSDPCSIMQKDRNTTSMNSGEDLSVREKAPVQDMGWVYDASPEVEHLSKWHTITAISVTFTLLMIMVGALRFWVRRHTIQTDDWIIFVTMIFSLLFNVFTILQTRYGLGLPLKLRPRSQLKKFTLYNYAARPFYLWGIAGFKLALCVSYLRLTDRTSNKRYRWLIVVVAVFSTTAETVFVFLNLFGCLPLAKNLNLALPGHCLPYGPVNYVISAVTILCDVVIFLLPIPLFFSLSLSRAVKLGLSFIFSLGLLTSLCSILRMSYIHRIAYGDGDSSMLVMLSALEINVGIIVSCLPLLRPLLKHIPRKIRGYMSSSMKRKQKYGGYAQNTGNSFPLEPRSRSRSGNNISNFSIPGRMAPTVKPGKGADSESEENILTYDKDTERGFRSANRNSDKGGITMTVDIEVDRQQHYDEGRRNHWGSH